MRYIALVDGKAGAYGVVIPDLPDCTSAGSTTDEALRKAVEAVRLWVEDAIDDGEALPTHGELSLHQFKSQLPSDELSGTLQGLDRYVALCLKNPIDLSAACVH